MKKINPRGLQVLVRPDGEGSRENAAGIITPGNVEQEERAIGTVDGVGAGVEGLKKGDRVIYAKYAGDEVEMDHKDKKIKYRLLLEEFVLATIEE